MNSKSAALSFIFAVLGALSACGPISAHSEIARAHIALEAAKGAQGEQLAIYEYRRAALYLRKAKEEEGLSSFQEAVDFAKKSRDFSDKALARALKGKQAKPRTVEELKRERAAGALPAPAMAPAAAMAPAPAPAPAPAQ